MVVWSEAKTNRTAAIVGSSPNIYNGSGTTWKSATWSERPQPKNIYENIDEGNKFQN
jgi:hypothetical protein